MTELDVVRIEALLHDTRLRAPTERPSVDALEDRLDAARVVHQSSIDAHVVTMNSVVVLTDCTSSAETELTLVYPKDADPERARVSVLSPMGRALIGAHVGDRLRITIPGQPDREFLVAAVTYQPEANGRFDL
ncbi:MAG TPA: GreA/GreB family elongation factor [Steroidobacteraceae bacterium]|nr:GreA/GreB family elongation factor [Steroidobacteraceae bacterium]